MMLLSVFSRRRMNGPVTFRSSSVASASPSRSMGSANRSRKLARAAQQAGVEHVHQRPQLGQAVLHRRPGHGDAPAGWDRAHRPGLRGAGVLDLLGLVEHQAAPRHLGQLRLVAGDEGVGGEDQVGARPPAPRRACRGR